jgi:hypothetical protein
VRRRTLSADARRRHIPTPQRQLLDVVLFRRLWRLRTVLQGQRGLHVHTQGIASAGPLREIRAVTVDAMRHCIMAR